MTQYRDASVKFESIQALRFAAAFMVVLFHWTQLQFDLQAPPFVIGASGVDIFFVISGFIIGHSSNAIGSVEFLRRRIVRVIPLYWALTAILFAVAFFAPSLLRSPSSGVVELLKSLFFFPYARQDGLVQPVLFLGWTLNYEMFFYFAMSIAIGARSYKTFALSAFFLALIATGYASRSPGAVVGFYTSPIILEFLFGLWIYEIYARWPRAFDRLALVAVVGWIALLAQNFVDLPQRELSKGIPAALIVIGTLTLSVPSNRLARGFVVLGDASYSMYLLHPYILGLVLKGLHPSSMVTITVVAFLSFAVICVASVLNFQMFEKPVGAFLNWLLAGSKGHQAGRFDIVRKRPGIADGA